MLSASICAAMVGGIVCVILAVFLLVRCGCNKEPAGGLVSASLCLELPCEDLSILKSIAKVVPTCSTITLTGSRFQDTRGEVKKMVRGRQQLPAPSLDRLLRPAKLKLPMLLRAKKQSYLLSPGKSQGIDPEAGGKVTGSTTGSSLSR